MELKLGQNTQTNTVPWGQGQETLRSCSEPQGTHHCLSLEGSSPQRAFSVIPKPSPEQSLLQDHSQ